MVRSPLTSLRHTQPEKRNRLPQRPPAGDRTKRQNRRCKRRGRNTLTLANDPARRGFSMKRRVLLYLALAVVCPGAALWAGPQALGSPFTVSTCLGCTKELPQVAGTPAGAFLVVWQAATGAQGSTETVPARLFAASGAPSGGEFPVDRRAASGQADGAVAADPQGNYVVVWAAKVD